MAVVGDVSYNKRIQFPKRIAPGDVGLRFGYDFFTAQGGVDGVLVTIEVSGKRGGNRAVLTEDQLRQPVEDIALAILIAIIQNLVKLQRPFGAEVAAGQHAADNNCPRQRHRERGACHRQYPNEKAADCSADDPAQFGACGIDRPFLHDVLGFLVVTGGAGGLSIVRGQREAHSHEHQPQLVQRLADTACGKGLGRIFTHLHAGLESGELVFGEQG
ncbi:MAG: hypothetical protein CAPSK01_003444 [Candidatus Accumulibacter vicinus]|uniref:Uncharacterized protein n=1 Tax=Candidatus Accumulibacter vicinus TaxID=2954382 RepID=A0A084XXY2_9PROT|nr:MAG: hypothetical protein CAPSK01_003444 [Candidatus Accumulibacter vicinus]